MLTSNIRIASAGDGSVTCLAPGARVVDIADACRSAALGFAWGAPGWTKRDLATWLVGPYARATASARAIHASGMRRAFRQRSVSDEAVTKLLADAHEHVIELLRAAWSWKHDAHFARAAVADGLVGGVIDDTSGIGYAPIDQPGMTLVRRVESLFLADFLTRPADYAAFAICSVCNGAAFDGGIYHLDCMTPHSGVVLRARARAQPEGNGIPEAWNAAAI